MTEGKPQRSVDVAGPLDELAPKSNSDGSPVTNRAAHPVFAPQRIDPLSSGPKRKTTHFFTPPSLPQRMVNDLFVHVFISSFFVICLWCAAALLMCFCLFFVCAPVPFVFASHWFCVCFVSKVSGRGLVEARAVPERLVWRRERSTERTKKRRKIIKHRSTGTKSTAHKKQKGRGHLRAQKEPPALKK